MAEHQHDLFGPLDEIIPSPTQPVHPPQPNFTIPLAEIDPYPQDDFNDAETPFQYIRNGEPRESLQRMVQVALGWLLFGLLSCFFKQPVGRQDIFAGECRCIINEALFRPIIHNWHRDLCDKSVENQYRIVSSLRDTLKFAGSMADKLDTLRNPFVGSMEPNIGEDTLSCVILAAKLLIEYLDSVCAAHLDALRPRYRRFPTFLSRPTPWFLKTAKVAPNAPSSRDYMLDERRISSRVFTVSVNDGDAQSSRTGRLLQCWLEQQGWCPAVATQVRQNYGYSVVYYLSRIRCKDALPVIEVGGNSTALTHELCQVDGGCKKYRMPVDYDMVPRHVCHQQDLCPPRPEFPTVKGMWTEHEGKLRSVLDHGQIPLISVNYDFDQPGVTLDLTVLPFDGTQTYTTISHVWSDGMGNDFNSALPDCQLRKIAKQIKLLRIDEWQNMTRAERLFTGRLSGPRRRLYFWMDILCIPQRGSSSGSRPNQNPSESVLSERSRYRSKAVQLITPTFQASSETLVIDPRIETIEAQDPVYERPLAAGSAFERVFTRAGIHTCEQKTDNHVTTEDELSAMLLGSNWMQRAWTFLEGSITRECRFKLTDSNKPPAKLRNLRAPGSSVWFPGRLLDLDDKYNHNRGDLLILKKAQHRISAALSPKQAWQARVRALLFGDSIPISEFPVPLKSIHAETLNDVRKQALRAGRTSGDKQRYDKSMASRWVLVHNNLRHRNATCETDVPVIIATLLDFDPVKVAKAPFTQRLPLMMHNSRQLPLSLLFNTEVPIYRMTEPRNSWISSTITGERLYDSPWVLENRKAPTTRQPSLLQRYSSNNIQLERDSAADDEPEKLYIRSTECEEDDGHRRKRRTCSRSVPQSAVADSGQAPVAFEVKPAQQPPDSHDTRLVHLTFDKFPIEDGSDTKSLLVEMVLPRQRLRPKPEVKNSEASRELVLEDPIDDQEADQICEKFRARYKNARKFVYLIDFSAGVLTAGGQRGCGARLLQSNDQEDGTFDFDCPFRVWTIEQWNLSHEGSGARLVDVPVIEALHVDDIRSKPIQISYTQPQILDKAEPLWWPRLEPIRLRTPPRRNPASGGVVIGTGTMTLILFVIQVSLIHDFLSGQHKADPTPIIAAFAAFVPVIIITACSMYFGGKALKRKTTKDWLASYSGDEQKKKPPRVSFIWRLGRRGAFLGKKTEDEESLPLTQR